MSNQVKINIKSPTSVEDQTLICDLESRVQDLKVQIQNEWLTHPRPKDQRLVYAGKLLENETILKNVLRLTDARDENNAFTVHLVCRITTPPPPSTMMTTSNVKDSASEAASHFRQRPVTNNPAGESQIQAPAQNNLPNPWAMMYSQSQSQDQVKPLLRIEINTFEITIYILEDK